MGGGDDHGRRRVDSELADPDSGYPRCCWAAMSAALNLVHEACDVYRVAGKGVGTVVRPKVAQASRRGVGVNSSDVTTTESKAQPSPDEEISAGALEFL